MTDVVPNDDPTIPDGALLWRRIPAWHIVYDDNLGRKRPTTDAFKDDSDGNPMSAALASLCQGPESVLHDHDGYKLAGFTAELARSCGQVIVREPKLDEPWHIVIVGKKTESVRKRFARQSTWVVGPD